MHWNARAAAIKMPSSKSWNCSWPFAKLNRLNISALATCRPLHRMHCQRPHRSMALHTQHNEPNFPMGRQCSWPGHESPFETLLGLVIAKSLNSVLVAQVSVFHRFRAFAFVFYKSQCQYYTMATARWLLHDGYCTMATAR